MTRPLSLNDICDGLQNHPGKLATIRGATAPRRNTLSHANRTRDPAMAEDLFWKVLEHCQSQSPGFGKRSRYSKLPKRFKYPVHAVDSTTIALVANCMDWAKHRRRKAAAKCHLGLDMQDMLRRFAVVDTAKESYLKRGKSWSSIKPTSTSIIFMNWLAKTSRGSRVPRTTWHIES